MNQRLIELRKEDNLRVMIRDLDTLFSVIESISRQKTNEKIENLNNIMH